MPIRDTQNKSVISKLARGGRLLGLWLATAPVSILLSVAILSVFIVSASIGTETLLPHVVAGTGHPAWAVLTATIWVSSPLHLVVDLLLLITLGAAVERQMGSVVYAVVGFLGSWLSILLAVVASRGISLIDQEWGANLANESYSGIVAFLLVTALTVSIRLDAVWRRRSRVVALTVILVIVGFSGTFESLVVFFAAAIGWVAGMALWTSRKDRRPLVGTRQEGRILVSMIVFGIVIGTLVSLRSSEMVGALATFRYGFWDDSVSADLTQQTCDVEGLEALCLHYSYLFLSDGWGARLLALMPLVFQLVLAWGLRIGRRAALWGTVVLQGLGAVLAVIHLIVMWTEASRLVGDTTLLGFGEDGRPTARFIVPIVVPLIIVIVVLWKRKLFTVKALPGTYARLWRQVGMVAAAILFISLVIAVSVGGQESTLSIMRVVISDFLIRLFPSSVLSFVTPTMIETTPVVGVLVEWAPVAVWLALIVLFIVSFQSQYLPGLISREQYQELLRTGEAGSMGWITTWEGNIYWKSSRLVGGVSYRAERGVALTVSDPAVSEDDLPELVREFTDFCSEQGLIPAFYSVHAPVVSITDSWGWSRLQVAEETVLPLADLEFKGKKFQDVRTALNRATKEGIDTRWTSYEECPSHLKQQIHSISEEWVSEKSLPEMGFTLGGIAELDDPEVRILLAVDDADYVHGITSWMPVYQEGEVIGWTLDFMRRREGGFRPVMEYLIASAALWAKEEDYEILSLSGAPLAKAEGASDEGSSARILDAVLDFLGNTLEPVYGFRSLLSFKAKFKPEYVPVYLAVPSLAELPTVGLAIGHAYVPNLSLSETLQLGKSLRKK